MPAFVGISVGAGEGRAVGSGVGESVGAGVGKNVGADVGGRLIVMSHSSSTTSETPTNMKVRKGHL